MPATTTIAIIADVEEKVRNITGSIFLEKYRILIVTPSLKSVTNIINDVKSKVADGDNIEVIDCLKNGCWEADIIILDICKEQQEEVADIIKEVVTQKIVINFSGDEKEYEGWRNLLPYAKVINMADYYSKEETIFKCF